MQTSTRRSTIVLCCSVLSLCGVSTTFAQEVPADTAIVTYEENVKWALVRTCFGCHSGMEARGGLLLDSYDALMQGGENGAPVVPGHPEKSILYQKLFPDPPFGKMMPRKRGLSLSEYELDMIRTWIEQGARRTNVAESR